MVYQRLTGRITEKGNKEPITYTTIQIKSKNTSAVLANTTPDMNGVFAFDIEKGEYILTIRAKGYEPYQRDITIKGRDKEMRIELRNLVIAPLNYRLTKFLPFG